ncbi:MAG: hypothetical protein GY862_03160 [Gammaproteobacteria bacterium]|nr:hypothetical protein [Gammaproteobacteria bacterium]
MNGRQAWIKNDFLPGYLNLTGESCCKQQKNHKEDETMMLMEIEQQIKPLSSQEKVKLMHFPADELAQHELEPARYFTAGDKHVVWSPCDEHKAAYQLQQLLEEQQPI